MTAPRFAPALLVALLLVPACDDKKEAPLDVPAKLEEAAARLRNNKLADAEKLYLRVLEADPANGEALGGMGRVRLEEKNYADAEILFGKALAKRADDAKLHALLAETYQLTDRHAEAAKSYGKAFELDRENSSYGLAQGRELNRSKQFVAAETVLREVAELDSKAQFVFTELGDSLREQKKLPEALSTYMKAQNTYRSDKMAFAGAAFVYEAQGDNAHALDEWSMYIRMDCCSDFSKGVAQKKVETLEVANAQPAAPDDGAAG